MTLYQITSYLKQIALSSPYIRTAEEGSVYTIMNGNPHSRYGVFVISQTQHRQDDILTIMDSTCLLLIGLWMI